MTTFPAFDYRPLTHILPALRWYISLYFLINVEGLTSRQPLGYENIDFMIFFDVRALKWSQNGSEPKKNIYI